MTIQMEQKLLCFLFD